MFKNFEQNTFVKQSTEEKGKLWRITKTYTYKFSHLTMAKAIVLNHFPVTSVLFFFFLEKHRIDCLLNNSSVANNPSDSLEYRLWKPCTNYCPNCYLWWLNVLKNICFSIVWVYMVQRLLSKGSTEAETIQMDNPLILISLLNRNIITEKCIVPRDKISGRSTYPLKKKRNRLKSTKRIFLFTYLIFVKWYIIISATTYIHLNDHYHLQKNDSKTQ